MREWFERYDFYVLAQNLKVSVATDATEEQKTEARMKNLATFVSKVDSGVYKLIKSLCRPETVNAMSYDDVKKRLMEHLSPKPTKFAQRYKFHKLVQREGQSASEFISELKSVGAECEYTNFNEALLDRLLVGLRDEKLVFELLVKETLTLDIAVKEVLGREQARKEAQLMNSCSGGRDLVNKVSYKKSNYNSNKQSGSNPKNSGNKGKFGSGVKCNRCKLVGHSGDQCNTKCYSCGQLYHVRNQCWKNKPQGKKGNSRCHNVEDDEEEYEENLSNICNIFPDTMYHVEDMFGQYQGFDCENIEIHDLFVSHLCKSKGECDDFLLKSKNVKINSVEFSVVNDSKLINNDLVSNDNSIHSADSIDFYLDIDSNDNILNHSDNSKSNLCKNGDSSVNSPTSQLASNRPDLPGNVVIDRRLVSDNLDSKWPVGMFKLNSSNKPILKCKINDKTLNFEFDTGSSLTVVSQGTLLGAGLNLNLTPSSRTLVVANGMNQPVKGYAIVEVELNHRCIKDLHLYVVDGYFPSLLGRSWIECF